MPIINSVIVEGGPTPSGTKQITTNGIHDISAYANADVQVPTTAPALYREFQLSNTGELQPNTTTTHIMNFTGMTKVGIYLLYKAYMYNTNISGLVDMSDLTTINGNYACSEMFRECPKITSVDLSSLTTISGSYACQNMFLGNYLYSPASKLASIDLSSLTTVNGSNTCQNMVRYSQITNIDLSSLTTINGNYACSGMFGDNSRVTNIDLSSLTSINGASACSSMFTGCSGITGVYFPSLNMIYDNYSCQNMFNSCTKMSYIYFYALTTSSFGSRTSQFNNMLSNVTGCTVHFPMAVQSKIGSWSSVTSGFGGTNTTVLFDLVTSLTDANANTYTRQEKDSTSTATAWNDGNDTLYYTLGVSDNTNGINEPSIGDTIYSDATCTTAVTTIDAIA